MYPTRNPKGRYYRSGVFGMPNPFLAGPGAPNPFLPGPALGPGMPPLGMPPGGPGLGMGGPPLGGPPPLGSALSFC